MLDSIQRKRYAKRFSAIESSFRIEDMDPSHDSIYQEAKTHILAGRMTPKQALSFVIKQSESRNCKETAASA